MTLDQINALNQFALDHGRNWRKVLKDIWLNDLRVPTGQEASYTLLRQIRNENAAVLTTFQPLEGGFKQVATLTEKQEERRRAARVRWGRAWAITDEKGKDLIQPWSPTKSDAKAIAKKLGIYLLP